MYWLGVYRWCYLPAHKGISVYALGIDNGIAIVFDNDHRDAYIRVGTVYAKGIYLGF